MQELTRAGIKPETLRSVGVRHVNAPEAKDLCGEAAEGLWIPYPNTEYGRLRIANPTNGKKYHQQFGTTVHAYITPSVETAGTGGDLALVEGEFKAISLHESGVRAIGLSGFYGFQKEGTLLAEIEEAIRRTKPERILFFGDSDTALNAQFADAAIRLARLVKVPVILPRIQLDLPKGIDDCREEMGDEFDSFLREIIKDAIEIESTTTPEWLALDLLVREKARLKAGYFGMAKPKALKRLVEIGARIKKDPIVFEELGGFLEQCSITGKRAFNQAVKRLQKERIEKAAMSSGGSSFDREQRIAEQFVFDGRRYFHERDGRWLTMERQDVLLTFDQMGASRIRDENDTRSPAENVLLLVQSDRRADYAGPICGRPAGLFEEGGKKILATTSPEFIEGDALDPEPGPLFDFFSGLIGRDQDEQWKIQLGLFFGWLKQARRAMTQPEIHLPGHCLGLIGARDCGKSLGQDLISLCMGGRSADASTWLQGRTDFNAQLWGAEHLTLSDANLEDDPRVKKAFRDSLKGIVANPIYPLARKYADEVSLRPIWRISVSANDDPQSSGVIPSPIADPSLADKVLYLKCYPPTEPFHGDDPQDRLRFWNRLVGDLRNFVTLVDNFEVDQEWQKGRFGVKEWVHPDIIELLDSANPDREFIEYLTDWLETIPVEWSGRAKDLFDEINRHSEGRFRERVCRNSTVLVHAMKRVAGLPDWSGRISFREDRFGPNRQKALRFTIKTENRMGLDG